MLFFKPTKLLAERHDEHGVIRVFERGLYRYLEFGDNKMEQSRILKDDPLWLEYDYTRAMLLAAIGHKQAETALFLGLGAGTVINACLSILPHLQDVEIIELRPDVPELAEQFFFFPMNDERITLQVGDAMQLIHQAETADLIFLDLYGEAGPAKGHMDWSYLRACYKKLDEDGWLIINQWAAWDGKPLGAALIRGVFGRQYWELPVSDGNVVLMVPQNSEQTPNFSNAFALVERVKATLGVDLTYLIGRIRPAS